MARESGIEIIDSDGHVIEPPGFWQEYADPTYRHRFPRVVKSATGVERLAWGEMAPDVKGSAPEVAELNGGSDTGSQGWEEASKGKMALTGGWDPITRLKDMDAEGIDIAVLYPTHMLFHHPEPLFFDALCRAYNDWLRDYCAADRNRLYGVGVVPLQDVGLAIQELQRCVGQLGFKGVMLRPAPYIGTHKLYHPVYDPFWAEAQELDCAVGVHPLPFGDLATVTRGLRLDEDMTWAGEGLFLRQGLANALDMMVALAWFVGGGICERFPKLRVAILEGSGGWAPTMLERLEHHFHIFGSAHQKTPPTELFQRQCWISFDPDEVALPFTAQHLGAERLLWASDYPHPDAKIPGVVAELKQAVAPLSEAQQREIMGASARSLYRL